MAQQQLTVHGAGYSTCTQRILTTLEELDVHDYKLQFVDMNKGVHKSPDFLKMQPFGQIPVLTDGDLTLFESRAISRYLIDKFEGQGTPLMGKTLAERARVNQWLEVESQNFNSPTSQIVYQVVFTRMFGHSCNHDVVAEQVAKLQKVLDVYEAHLATSKYLAGDFFSMADLSHLPYGNMLVNAAGQAELFWSRPHVSAWWKEISSRPSFVKVQGMNEFAKE